MVLATSQQEFSDADFRVVDNGDQSKKLAFEVSGIATGTTRTWTVPDTNVTVSAFGATLIDDTNAGAALTTLGVTSFMQTVLDDTTASAALTTLGVSSFIQGFLDESDRGGALLALGIRFATGNIADDAASSIDVGNFAAGGVILWATGAAQGGIFAFRVFTASQGATGIANTATPTVGYTTGALTGTTSTDGRVTFSAHTDGKLYIENRSGGTLPFNLFVFRSG